MYKPETNGIYRVAARLTLWVLVLFAAGPLVEVALGAGITAADASAWIEATPAAGWSARHGHATVVFDEKIWVLGGNEDPSYQEVNDVWYSADGVNWTLAVEHAPWPARQYHAAATFDAKMWVLGGLPVTGPNLNDVWYSSDGVNWLQATEHAGWFGRCFIDAVVFDEKLWIIGGQSSHDDVWYSSDGANWTRALEDLPWPNRYGNTVTVFDETLWVLGGHSYYGGLEVDLNDVWRSPNGANWTEVSGSAAWPGRYLHSTEVFGGMLWVFGGMYGVGYPRARLFWRNDVWCTADGIKWVWVDQQASWAPRSGHTTAVLDNKLWVLGGKTFRAQNLVCLNDVWYLPGAAADGEGEGEAPNGPHTADRDGDWRIGLGELLRVIQFYNAGGFHCAESPGDTEDGYVPGPGANHSCAAHASDYLGGPDWTIALSEVLRLIQFFNLGGYRLCAGDGTQDGYCAGPS